MAINRWGKQVKRGVVVALRGSNGRLTGVKGIVLRLQKPSNFSRAYGIQAEVCVFFRGGRKPSGAVHYVNISDVNVLGRVKRVPKCESAR